MLSLEIAGKVGKGTGAPKVVVPFGPDWLGR